MGVVRKVEMLEFIWSKTLKVSYRILQLTSTLGETSTGYSIIVLKFFKLLLDLVTLYNMKNN